MSDETPVAAIAPGDFVRIVGVADFNNQEGAVAWIDGDKLGVWIETHRMPVTFLRAEVRRVEA